MELKRKAPGVMGPNDLRGRMWIDEESADPIPECFIGEVTFIVAPCHDELGEYWNVEHIFGAEGTYFSDSNDPKTEREVVWDGPDVPQWIVDLVVRKVDDGEYDHD